MSTPSASRATPATRQRWMLWSLLLALTLSGMAWLDDSDGDESADTSRARRARRPPPNAVAVPAPDLDVSAASRLAQAVERLELPKPVKAENSVPANVEKNIPTDPNTPDAAAPAKLLAARSWYVAPPPSALPPEAPKAPALPFKVLGRIIEGDAPVVFLAHQNRNLIAREGEQLDSTYLVERIEKNRMTLIYLPLAERQYLTLGAVN
jgi:hypothetical protein